MKLINDFERIIVKKKYPNLNWIALIWAYFGGRLKQKLPFDFFFDYEYHWKREGGLSKYRKSYLSYPGWIYPNLWFFCVLAMVVLGLILLCTVAICIKARASRKMAGFSRLNLEDEDDEYDEYYDNGSTKKFINKEYHDDSTDEEDVFEKKLLKR